MICDKSIDIISLVLYAIRMPLRARNQFRQLYIVPDVDGARLAVAHLRPAVQPEKIFRGANGA